MYECVCYTDAKISLHSQLIAVLREVRYLRFMETENVPEGAITLYNQHNTFRNYVANLDLTVKWYNHVRQNVLSVELPLIASQLEDIDNVLHKAESTLSWVSDGTFSNHASK